MSISLIPNPDDDGKGEAFEIAPNFAWYDFVDTIVAMPDAKEKHFRLDHLVSEGVCGDPTQVAASLKALMKGSQLNESGKAVARRLRSLIKNLGPDSELLWITD